MVIFLLEDEAQVFREVLFLLKNHGKNKAVRNAKILWAKNYFKGKSILRGLINKKNDYWPDYWLLDGVDRESDQFSKPEHAYMAAGFLTLLKKEGQLNPNKNIFLFTGEECGEDTYLVKKNGIGLMSGKAQSKEFKKIFLENYERNYE